MDASGVAVRRVEDAMKHTLKLQQPFFDAVADGKKTFEIRSNDRGFQTGDEIEFREFKESYCTGRSFDAKVGYLLSGWGLEPGYVAFSVESVGMVRSE
jgi:hypothetical protein